MGTFLFIKVAFSFWPVLPKKIATLRFPTAQLYYGCCNREGLGETNSDDRTSFPVQVLVDFSSLVSFKEITDLAVLSYGMNFINDAEFLLLYNSYSSENLYLPFHLYPELDLQNFNEEQCLTEFRFKKADIPRLARALQIPDVIRCYQGTIATGLNIQSKSVGIEQI